MAKLTKRERKELNLKNQTLVTGTISTSEKKVHEKPKKKHICIFHKYQELSDGTLICSICNHHFQKKMDETRLTEYLKNKNCFSLGEISEMDFHLLKVTYARSTKGTLNELDAEELTGKSALEVVDKAWGLFWFLSDDMTFDHDASKELYKQLAQNCKESSTPLPRPIGDSQKDGSLPANIEWIKTERCRTGKKECIFKNSDGKIIYYHVVTVIANMLPDMSMSQTDGETFLSTPDDAIDIPIMRYNERSVLSRKLIFDAEGNLEEQSIYLKHNMNYRLKR